MKEFNKAISLNKNYSTALNNKGYLLYLLKEYKQALIFID